MNYNNLSQKTNFTAGSPKFDKVPFFITTINIPGISLPPQEVGGRDGAKGLLTGNSFEYSALSFEMLIDEDFHIYNELYDVLDEYINIETGEFKEFVFDFFVQLTNSKGNPGLKLEFHNCRIESIGDISLDTTDDTTQYTLSMEMRFDYFTRHN